MAGIPREDEAEGRNNMLLFVEHAPTSMAMFDRNMRYLAVSRRWISDYRLGEQDIVGKSHYEVFPEITEQWKAIHLRGLSGEIVSAQNDRFDRNDGTVQWLNWEVRPWYRANEDIGGIVILTEDVTGHKDAENRLAASEARYRALFENMNAGFVLFGVVQDGLGVPVDLIILAANKKFEATTGLKAGNVIGQRLTEVLPGIEQDAADWIGIYGKVALTGEPQQFEHGSDLLGAYYSISAYRAEPNQCAVTFQDNSERRESARLLEKSEERWKFALEGAGQGVWDWNPQTDEAFFSNAWQEMIGYVNHDFPKNGAAWVKALHPEDRDRVLAAVRENFAQQGRPYDVEFRMRCHDGSWKWIEALGMVTQRDSAGHPIRMMGTHTDISARKEAEIRLKEEQEAFRCFANIASDYFWVLDEQFRFLSISPSIAIRSGLMYLDYIGKTRWELPFVGISDEEWEKHRALLLAHRPFRDFEGGLANNDGEIRWFLMSGDPVFTDDRRFLGYRGVTQDITDRKLAEEKILQLAYYDQLTGLPNRRLFRDRLELDMKRVMRNKSSLALLFLDLDKFKEVNDTLGHDKGDILLIEAARRIRQHVRDADTLARLGGDEFAIALPEYGEIGHIDRVVQDVIESLEIPFDLGGGSVGHISGSIGIALYPQEASSIDDLLKHADQAMYTAKHSSASCFNYFTRSMQEEAISKVDMINDLRHALERNQLEVYFQPIVDARTGQIVKAEALLRWHHPLQGMISPAIFIPLAEESGLILTIGEWVFEEALRNIARWKESAGKLVQVSVNKSSVQFMHNDQHHWHESYLSSGLPEHIITVEITESLLLSDSEKIRTQFNFFKEHGIELSIDDFGTGFSALSYLHQFDVDYLKIDKSFIQKMVTDSSSRALTEAIIIMAHKLGIRTIAEGVETEAQRDLLASFGCDYVQGYLYSKPIPACEFEKLLAN